MSLDVLRAVNAEIGLEAARKKRVPYVPFDATEPETWPPFPFPNLGGYLPPGWERTEAQWFVDTTGYGRESEPALTWRRFKDLIAAYVAEHPDHGYAVVEEGQFQVMIAALRRLPDSANESTNQSRAVERSTLRSRRAIDGVLRHGKPKQ